MGDSARAARPRPLLLWDAANLHPLAGTSPSTKDRGRCSKNPCCAIWFSLAREWRNGRRAGLRIRCRKAWGFKSPLSHSLSISRLSFARSGLNLRCARPFQVHVSPIPLKTHAAQAGREPRMLISSPHSDSVDRLNGDRQRGPDSSEAKSASFVCRLFVFCRPFLRLSWIQVSFNGMALAPQA